MEARFQRPERDCLVDIVSADDQLFSLVLPSYDHSVTNSVLLTLQSLKIVASPILEQPREFLA